MRRCLIALLLLLPLRAVAWGPDGHRIVGYIAEQHLSPKAKSRLAHLIGSRRHFSDNFTANWPDFIRSDRPETAPWHYVDIPIHAKRYDPHKSCRHGQCVVSAIERFANVLADRTASYADRTEALRFLVHFVGDIHQPLHCAERDHDQGGNLCKVFFLDRPDETNLHKVWDLDIPRQSIGQQDVLEYAEKLRASLTVEQRRTWGEGRPSQWAWESHELAVAHVYLGVPSTIPPQRLSETYVRKGQQIADMQLQKAGLRLAALLNQGLQ